MEPITIRARELRKKQTPAESFVWQQVRNRKLGAKIVRQKPIILDYFGKKKAFVADFYCNDAGLAIEIDGDIHSKQSDYDSLRAMLLNQTGIRLIRFTNDEVMKNIDGVLVKIKNETASPRPAATPLQSWRGENGTP
jgi:very-short-patch-repair endonuclease